MRACDRIAGNFSIALCSLDEEDRQVTAVLGDEPGDGPERADLPDANEPSSPGLGIGQVLEGRPVVGKREEDEPPDNARLADADRARRVRREKPSNEINSLGHGISPSETA